LPQQPKLIPAIPALDNLTTENAHKNHARDSDFSTIG
jgi:hypothetical protein